MAVVQVLVLGLFLASQLLTLSRLDMDLAVLSRGVGGGDGVDNLDTSRLAQLVLEEAVPGRPFSAALAGLNPRKMLRSEPRAGFDPPATELKLEPELEVE